MPVSISHKEQVMNESKELPQGKSQANWAEWKRIVVQYQQPSAARASWQIVSTLVPYALLWFLMYQTLKVSWWITVPLAILAGAFLVRVFIIFHDCGHGSFFKSRTANDVWGFLCGMLTFTPYYHWRWEHSLHHATSGDLDRRGTGDLWTMTVQEYLESSRWKRFAYRLARNPIVLFVGAPFYLFVIRHRFPKGRASRRERARNPRQGPRRSAPAGPRSGRRQFRIDDPDALRHPGRAAVPDAHLRR